ncbi:MAG: hypothetical protein KTR22_01715 [Flavobacteriaceae bacterium]|nr:hypothetical protein [Flavobacteriaceae bacterium]
MTTTNKPNVLFWVIGVLALLWNLMGVFQFALSNFMKDAMADSYTAEQLELVNGLPSWYNIVFGVAVFGGVLGCIFMLMRKKLAVTLFLLSLLAVIIQMGYWVFATDVMDVMGVGSVIMPIVVVIIALFLYMYSKNAVKKGWLA